MTIVIHSGEFIAVCVLMFALTVIAYGVGRHDPRYRRAIYRTERARAQKDIADEHKAKIADLESRCTLLRKERTQAYDEVARLHDLRTAEAAQLAEATAALARIDALIEELRTSRWYITARRVAQARLGVRHISDVRLGKPDGAAS